MFCKCVVRLSQANPRSPNSCKVQKVLTVLKAQEALIVVKAQEVLTDVKVQEVLTVVKSKKS